MGDTLAGVCFWCARQPRVAANLACRLWLFCFLGCVGCRCGRCVALWVVFGTGRARPSCSDDRHCDRWGVPLRVSCCARWPVGWLWFLCGFLCGHGGAHWWRLPSLRAVVVILGCFFCSLSFAFAVFLPFLVSCPFLGWVGFLFF